jgi:hypothetical protein
MVGRRSVWSAQTRPVWPRRRTPGPAKPTQVVAISGAMPPWFHANPGCTCEHGALQSGAPAKPK